MQKTLNLYFYDPQNDPVNVAWFVNSFVSFVSGPFCHVELEFPGFESCSIVMGSAVMWRQRQFDKNYYTCLPIVTTPQKYERAYKICKRHFEAMTKFGFSQDCTYCSRLIVDILVEAQIIPATYFADHRIIFPSQIYNKLVQVKNDEVSSTRLQNIKSNKKLTKNVISVSGTKIVAIDFNKQYAHQLTQANANVYGI